MSTDAPWNLGEQMIPRKESVIQSSMEIVHHGCVGIIRHQVCNYVNNIWIMVWSCRPASSLLLGKLLITTLLVQESEMYSFF